MRDKGAPLRLRGPFSRGFTLIELMIVVAIIGILAAIAIPKFADLIRKSAEGTSKGNLGGIRSALSVYYGDMEGQYPADLASLTVVSKYFQAIPVAKAPNYHSDNSVIEEQAAADDQGGSPSGGWVYDNIATDPNVGVIWVNCTHTDTKGTTWTSY